MTNVYEIYMKKYGVPILSFEQFKNLSCEDAFELSLKIGANPCKRQGEKLRKIIYSIEDRKEAKQWLKHFRSVGVKFPYNENCPLSRK